jgi:hypothetical protein
MTTLRFRISTLFVASLLLLVIGSYRVTTAQTQVWVSIDDAQVKEGDSGTTYVSLHLHLTAPVTEQTIFYLQSSPGTATPDQDYASNTPNLVLFPNQSGGEFRLPLVFGDTTFEPDETFTLTITGSDNSSVGIADGEATVTILNDDAQPPVDTTPPDVTINQASAQADPTNDLPIQFSAVFSEPIDISTFTANDIALSGSAGLGSAVVSISEVSPNDGTTFQIAVSGVTGGGTVKASVPANVVKDLAGNGNTASTSTDNTVTLYGTLTVPIAAAGDDVNQTGTRLEDGLSTIYFGRSNQPVSLTGLRFNHINLPQGAIILDAQLRVYTPTSQWISVDIEFAGERKANSLPFSPKNLPALRPLTSARVASVTNSLTPQGWTSYTGMQPIVQEIVNQPGWASGSSLSFIIKGRGKAWGRKFYASYEAGPSYAPQLIIRYYVPG